ncbi:DUF6801 domain-containing protein [Kitasatospora sp. NPDC088346]|uniref:DUF6801 domain-containing protein n=1 Tax=Kitasatospora sp. NPDC088346 TaxID=3364073 RepID=UPI00382E0104
MRTVVAVATAWGAAGVVGVLGTGTAAAQPASPTLRYSCTFPTIGAQPITARISTDIPRSLAAGEPSPPFAINAAATVDASFTFGLRYILGVRIIEGSLDAQTTVTAPQGGIGVPVHLTITKATIPASGSFDIPATGTAPTLTFTEPGSAKITAGNFTLHLVPEDANGNVTGPGRTNVPCTLNAGQDNVVATLDITAPRTTTGTTAPGTPGTPGAAGGPTAAPDTATPTGPTASPLLDGSATATAVPTSPTGAPASDGSGTAPAGAAPPDSTRSTINAAATTTATTGGRGTGGVVVLLAGVLAAATATAAAAFRFGPRLKRRRASQGD